MWSRVRKDSHYQENPLLSPLSASLSLSVAHIRRIFLHNGWLTVWYDSPDQSSRYWLALYRRQKFVRLPVARVFANLMEKRGGIDVGVFSSFLFVDQTLKEEDPRVDRTRASCLAQWKNKKKEEEEFPP